MTKKILTDEKLMLDFQKGNGKAYNELVDRYKDKLLNHIYYYTKSKERAEDIVQETFVKVYLNKEKYKEIARVSTWIYTIAINLAKTELMKNGKMKKFSISGDDGERDFEIKDVHTSTDKEVMQNELKEKLLNSIELLGEKFKEIIIYRDIDELSYDEIASIINIPVGTVKSRLNRARLILRDLVFGYVKA